MKPNYGEKFKQLGDKAFNTAKEIETQIFTNPMCTLGSRDFNALTKHTNRWMVAK
jgi:heme oxygenase